MSTKHPEISYSEFSDPSDVLLPDEEEDEEEDDNEKDDTDDDEEVGDGYSACPCLVGEG